MKLTADRLIGFGCAWVPENRFLRYQSRRARLKACRVDARPQRAKGLSRRRDHHDLPSRVVAFGIPVASHADRPAHMQEAASEVDVAPLQAQQLAQAQSSREADEKEGIGFT